MAVSSPTEDYSVPSIIPRAAVEQVIINQCTSDAVFRHKLLDNPVSALSGFFGAPIPVDVRVYVEDANTFYYVTANTDPAVGQFNTQVGSAPPLMVARASFVGRLNYLLSNPVETARESAEHSAKRLGEAILKAKNDSKAAQQAETEAAQAARSLADAIKAAGDANLEQIQTELDAKKQSAKDSAIIASKLRDVAREAASEADELNEQYEDSLRITFQEQFAADPIAALNTFFNLETPFSEPAVTIYDTDWLDGNTPPVIDPPAPDEIRFIHLVESTGRLLFLVLPYAPHRSLFMGPYSIAFDGTSSYIQVQPQTNLCPKSLAVEARVQVENFRDGYNDVVLSTLTDTGGWQLELGGGIPKFTVMLDGVARSVAPPNPLPDGLRKLKTGKWLYLVGILDSGKLSIYVNGYKYGSIFASGSISAGGDLLMGRNAAMQADQSFLQGMIHEVRIWGGDDINGAFTSKNPAFTALPAPPLTALLAHYLFDEGADFTAIDDSPYHNDGIMVNAIWKITGEASPD